MRPASPSSNTQQGRRVLHLFCVRGSCVIRFCCRLCVYHKNEYVVSGWRRGVGRTVLFSPNPLEIEEIHSGSRAVLFLLVILVVCRVGRAGGHVGHGSDSALGVFRGVPVTVQ